MKIFSGTSNQPLYNKIISHIGEQYRGNVGVSKFSDGEICVQYKDNIRGEDVYIVQSMTNPINDSVMEMLIMVDAAKRASASRVTAVIPFYAYARQDRKDKPRVPITAKMLANILVAAGTDRVLTMDLHADQIQGFFDIPVDHVYSFPVFVKHFKGMFSHDAFKNDIVIVAPDAGSAKRAVKYAEALGTGFAICSKQRIDGESIATMGLVGNVKDKTCIVMDDLTTTGSTLVGCANKIMENGGKDVIAGVSHNVASREGIEKMRKSPISRLFVTDSVNAVMEESQFVSVLSISKLFADAIKCINGNDSVSSLFKV